MNFPQTIKILAEQIREARVDHSAFETLLKPCELVRCRATCCHDGVHISEEEGEYIEGVVSKHRTRLLGFGLLLGEQVLIDSGRKTVVREAQAGELATDFPEHFPRTRCVFLNHHGHCGLQSLAMEDGADEWLHKPLTCWLHPLVLIPAGKWEDRPVLTLVNSTNDPQKKGDYAGYASCTHCGRADAAGKPAWQVLEKELRRLSEICDRDVYAELSAPACDW